MKSKVIQIRDLELIEAELNSAQVGVLASADDKENVGQFVVPFLYSDKNIYFLFDNADDLSGLLFEHNASFVIFRNTNNGSNLPSFKFFQVKCSGILKKVDEARIIEEVNRNYNQKYSESKESVQLNDLKIIMIDTEEIQAAEIVCY